MTGITKKGERIEISFEVTEREDYISVSLSKDFDYSNIEVIEADYFGEVANNTDEGYLVLPRGGGNGDYCILNFNKHTEDFVKNITESNMPVFGVKKNDKTFLAVVSGMPYDYDLRVELKDNKYRIFPVFNIFGEQPYEDLKIEFFMLSGDKANYSGMAVKYRELKLASGELIPLAKRIENNSVLDYTAKSVMIRVRCGWKPAPSQVLHQTKENEPEMYVACDFDRVSDLLDELKNQGVEKAEICLVGWNVKGHDGRWPEALPVCEELGGEEKLRAVIKKAQSMGYQITCHTNSTDQYEIAENFDVENSQYGRNSEPTVNPAVWSGGQMFNLCPKIGAEQAREMLPKVRELGFKGTHYVDVLGIVHPRRCFSEKHYVNSKDAVKYAKDICELSKELFGGFSSEGAYDFICPYTDFGLYISFQPKEAPIADKPIPFWQLVYHGIVLSNPYSYTINPTFKDKATNLKVIEYGGRPSYYYYSAFMGNGNNWMGSIDARCGTDEELKGSVANIKKGYDEYKKFEDITTAFMNEHKEVAENVYEITYSDNTVVKVDYNTETYEIVKK